MKDNSKEWFDSVVSEGINNRDKLFKKFKKSRLRLELEDYKKVRYGVKKLLKKNKVVLCSSVLQYQSHVYVER